jgi:hypothetical protein
MPDIPSKASGGAAAGADDRDEGEKKEEGKVAELYFHEAHLRFRFEILLWGETRLFQSVFERGPRVQRTVRRRAMLMSIEFVPFGIAAMP